MLHEVVGGLDPGAIVSPIRMLLRHTNVIEGEVGEIDLAARTVRLGERLDGRTPSLEYDQLVLAIGSETNFFNIPGLAERAAPMKTLTDAMLLRNRLIATLEAAVLAPPEERSALLTIVVAGGGFAGVETVGALNDVVRDALPYYPSLRDVKPRVLLVHPGEVILPELGEKLGHYAQNKLVERGVEVLVKRRVAKYSSGRVELDDGTIFLARTLVWTAGVSPSPALAALPCRQEKHRVVASETLAVPEHPGVWAVGDCAYLIDPATSKPYPPTAQHAMRQGAVVAENILATLGGTAPRPFRYKSQGQLAVIGQRCGVAEIYGFHFSGLFAWFLWRTVYLFKLPGLEKKIRVAVDWTLDLFFPKNLMQRITFRGVEALSAQVHALTEDFKHHVGEAPAPKPSAS
jgi:NADH dehydrogenase